MKKGKLLLSLSLMSLAIAILCFGVLSAVTVNYGISGNITYSIQDVFVKINTRVYKVAAQQDKKTVIANVKTLETTPLASISTSTYTLSQTMVEYDSTNADTKTVTHQAKDSSGNTVQITYGDYYTYYIVINIQNLTSAKGVYAYLTDNTTGDTNSVKTTNLYQNDIKSTETKNIVIAYSIKDKTSEVTSVALEYSLKVSYEDTDYTDPITITNDKTNSYYYVTLGKTASTETTPNIRWKLVSLDGMNKYTYDKDDNFETRYLSDAIFLQQSVSGGTVAFDAASTDYPNGYNNYYESDIRTNINTLSSWNLTESDVSTLISKRNITGIEAYGVDGTYMYKGKTDDYFWLLSDDEVKTFLGTTGTDRKWIPDGNTSGVVFWLRSPYSGLTSTVYGVESGGDFNYYGAFWQSGLRVRAAFQLA